MLVERVCILVCLGCWWEAIDRTSTTLWIAPPIRSHDSSRTNLKMCMHFYLITYHPIGKPSDSDSWHCIKHLRIIHSNKSIFWHSFRLLTSSEKALDLPKDVINNNAQPTAYRFVISTLHYLPHHLHPITHRFQWFPSHRFFNPESKKNQSIFPRWDRDWPWLILSCPATCNNYTFSFPFLGSLIFIHDSKMWSISSGSENRPFLSHSFLFPSPGPSREFQHSQSHFLPNSFTQDRSLTHKRLLLINNHAFTEKIVKTRCKQHVSER